MKRSDFLKRPWCHLVGCRMTHLGATGCVRCGADLYEDWIQVSICNPLQEALWKLSRLLRPVRCDHCNKRLWRLNLDPYATRFCSSQCEENWIPF